MSGLDVVARRSTDFVRDALRWWFGELSDLLPVRLTSFFAGDGAKLLVRVHDRFIRVECADTSDNWELPFEGAGDVPASLRALLQGGAGVVVLLPARIILRREVELPLAAASELVAATSFLIDRQTPFRTEQTYHSARLLSRDRARKLLRAELIVAPRARVDDLVAALAARRIPVSSIRMEGEGGKDLDFRPKENGAHLPARRKEAWKPVLAAGLALLIAGPLLVGYRIHYEARALAAELAVAEESGGEAAALRSEIDARAAEQTFLPKRQRSLRAIEVLDALTNALADDSWLFSMELRPGQAVLAGFSSNIPELIERLTKSPFSAPELTAPVVNGLTRGKSRFELRVQVKDIAS